MVLQEFLPRGRRAVCAAWLAFGTFAALGALADDGHDRARQAVESGQILPLRTILERVEREYPGQVMDVDLEREHGHEHDGRPGPERWIYKLKVLRAGGTLVRLKVDARDGRILGSKERPPQESREKKGN